MNHTNVFRAGAAKCSITPLADYFPMYHAFNTTRGFGHSYFGGGILTDIFVRVLVMDDGVSRAVIAVFDLPGIPYTTNDMIDIISDVSGAEKYKILVTCTHNHSGPYVDDAKFHMAVQDEDAKQKLRRYNQFVRDALRTATLTAVSRLELAKIGFGRGNCYININRHAILESGAAYSAAYNFERPLDRELSMIRIDSLSGKPICLLFNYAMHACAMIHNNPKGRGTEISGDIPGVCCLNLESHWGNDAIAIFTSGAAGDVNPLMMSRINFPKQNGKADVVDLGIAAHAILEFMGMLFTDAALKVAESITSFKQYVPIHAAKARAECPASAFVPPFPADKPRTFEFTLLGLGDIVVLASNGEIYTAIGMRLKESSPFKNTMYITHAGERVGYVKDDSGAGEAEAVIRQNLLSMIDDYSTGVVRSAEKSESNG